MVEDSRVTAEDTVDFIFSPRRWLSWEDSSLSSTLPKCRTWHRCSTIRTTLWLAHACLKQRVGPAVGDRGLIGVPAIPRESSATEIRTRCEYCVPYCAHRTDHDCLLWRRHSPTVATLQTPNRATSRQDTTVQDPAFHHPYCSLRRQAAICGARHPLLGYNVPIRKGFVGFGVKVCNDS
jgi:hypothetical protein